MGFNSSHWTCDNDTYLSSGKKYVGQLMYENIFANKDVFDGFSCDCITQADICLPASGLNHWPQLDASVRHLVRSQYPDCLFVLLKRDPVKIIHSIKLWMDLYFRIIVSEIPGLPAWIGSDDKDIHSWICRHYETIEQSLQIIRISYLFH